MTVISHLVIQVAQPQDVVALQTTGDTCSYICTSASFLWLVQALGLWLERLKVFGLITKYSMVQRINLNQHMILLNGESGEIFGQKWAIIDDPPPYRFISIHYLTLL